ncbi:pilus assembly protein PilQ [Cronobacter sakazakii]|nr:pilus assembly protein PilQ [Cronobacter sakazakii]
MEYLSLSSSEGVPDYKITPLLRDSLIIRKVDNKKIIEVARTEVSKTEVMDYLNAFKERHPDAQTSYIEKSQLMEHLQKGGFYSDDASKSDMQGQVIDILRAAVNKRATDVHIRVGNDFTLVKFRIDKVLVNFEEYSAEKGKALVYCLYQTMCEGNSNQTFSETKSVEANIDEEFVKELGLSGGRLSSRPTDEKVLVVIRLLKKRERALTLRELGMNDYQCSVIERVTAIPSGVVLLSGPTNSGKSTLAQSMIEMVTTRHPGLHFITVEDPIENNIRGAVQTPLAIADRSNKELMGRAWGDAIENLVRLDPDQMFIGEIRGEHSATGCISAAQTGRKVYTTIHTDYPVDIIARLKALSVDTDLLTNASLIVCLIGQRTAPLLCEHCKEPYSVVKNTLSQQDKRVIEQFCLPESVFLQRQNGCEKCNYTGTRGMTGIYEIIETTVDFMRIYHEEGKMKAYEYWYRHGGETLCANLIELINSGKISPIYAHHNVCNLDRDERMFSGHIRKQKEEHSS